MKIFIQIKVSKRLPRKEGTYIVVDNEGDVSEFSFIKGYDDNPNDKFFNSWQTLAVYWLKEINLF